MIKEPESYLRCRIDGEFELWLFAIVHAKPFHEQGRETRAGATAERMEHQEALQSRALIGQLPYPIQHNVHNLLADRVMAARIVVGRILFARYQLLRMEQLAVRARAHLVHDGRLQVDEHRPRHMLSAARLTEERVEWVVAAADRLVRGHLTVRLDAMLQTVQLPASVSDLHARLANVYRNAFSLWKWGV